ncbi:MAG TPA: CARDB domain-containing protein [Candidatus Rubrimentiphilum sp.]|nr:CARDB domain-containing protein [Candidatus Rubrimentiphilum sp.]
MEHSSKFVQRAVLVAAMLAACTANAVAQVRPTPTPSPTPIPTPTPSPRPLPRGIAPPSPIYPIMAGLQANPPFSFLWTPVNGATRYELQISDRFDVRSHVLVDVVVPGIAYGFSNLNVPGSGFTALQPAGVPLPGGPYHWRVRAINGGTATIFSPIANFTLGTVSGGMPIHDLAVASISVDGDPVAGIPSAILVRIENRGSFPATGANVMVTAGGQTIASERVKPLIPGDSDTVALSWTPPTSGFANIVAKLDYADDIPAHKNGSFTFSVQPQKTVQASFLGVIGGMCGSYVLQDAQGNTIAQLLLPHGVLPTPSLYGQTVLVTGNFSIGAQGPQIAATSVRLAAAANSGRNPCQ